MKLLNYWNLDYTDQDKAVCYIKVFWEAPWNEWYIWESWTLYPLSQKIFPEKVKKFYDQEKLTDELWLLSKKQWYREILAEVIDSESANKNSLVGFVTWWEWALKEINNDKLLLSPKELITLEENINKYFPDFDLKRIFYNAEIWVIDSMRGQWISSTMFRKCIQEVLAWGVDSVLVRTTKKSDQPFLRFKNKLWFTVVYDYNDDQERTILALKMNK